MTKLYPLIPSTCFRDIARLDAKNLTSELHVGREAAVREGHASFQGSPMKRKRKGQTVLGNEKRQKIDLDSYALHSQPLFSKYYPVVSTLRQYLASPGLNLSKKQRRKLQQYGREANSPSDHRVISLLDNTIVGSFGNADIGESSFRDEDISVFTQQLTKSPTLKPSTPGALKQREVCSTLDLRWLRLRFLPVDQQIHVELP